MDIYSWLVDIQCAKACLYIKHSNLRAGGSASKEKTRAQAVITITRLTPGTVMEAAG